MKDIFKSKEELNIYVPIFMNLLPLMLATLEYYFDTISTEISLVQRLWPLSLPLPLTFILWNYMTQVGYYRSLGIVIIPMFDWTRDSSSFRSACVFAVLQVIMYASVAAIGRQKVEFE